jgi:hypothetical protein
VRSHAAPGVTAQQKRPHLTAPRTRGCAPDVRQRHHHLGHSPIRLFLLQLLHQRGHLGEPAAGEHPSTSLDWPPAVLAWTPTLRLCVVCVTGSGQVPTRHPALRVEGPHRPRLLASLPRREVAGKSTIACHLASCRQRGTLSDHSSPSPHAKQQILSSSSAALVLQDIRNPRVKTIMLRRFDFAKRIGCGESCLHAGSLEHFSLRSVLCLS